MSALPSRALLTAGPVALALVLASPGAAAAEQGASSERPGRTASAASPSPQASPAGGRSGDRSGPGTSTAARTASPKASSAASPQGGPAGRRGGRPGARPKADEGVRPASSPRPARSAAGDPRGNNGTIKIDGLPLDDGRGNEPHVGCAFAVDFFGFDRGQTADLVFTGQAPTGTGVLLSRSAVPISDDAAGGGQDRDASLVFTAEQLGLGGVAPHRNGWHVKVAVDVREAPGGAKQKVFWLQCAQAGAAGVASPAALPSPLPGGGTTGGAGGTTVDTGSPSSAGRTGLAGAGVAGLAVSGAGAGAATRGGGAVAVDAKGRGPADGAGTLAARDTGSSRVLGGALPFTGAQGVLALLVVGGAAVGAGVLALLASRRRDTAL